MVIKELRNRREFNEMAYFEKKNREALARLKARHKKPRLSPVTGEPMEEKSVLGVIVDHCPKSNGIWLDAGELEQIIKIAKYENNHGNEHWCEELLASIKKAF